MATAQSEPSTAASEIRHAIAAQARRGVLLALFAACCTACAPLQAPVCAAGARAAAQETLYFGTAKPGGLVSVQEWEAFLRAEVTPRFPQGLSVWQAAGQWRSADGHIVREASQVLNLIHAGDAASEQAVADIIATYKRAFQQEAVLRVRSPACVSF